MNTSILANTTAGADGGFVDSVQVGYPQLNSANNLLGERHGANLSANLRAVDPVDDALVDKANVAQMPALTSSHASHPRHVSIIMDGNNRWAHLRGCSLEDGYEAGAQAARAVIRCAIECETVWLTLFAFSTENWNRPSSEIDVLMRLLSRSLRESLDFFLELGVRVRFIGDIDRFSPDVRAAVHHIADQTKNRSQLQLIVALGYGGRLDIVRAARGLAEDVANGRLSPNDITEDMFASRLMTAGIPDPDLLIRTGGRLRISNFMTWQSSYTELYFSPRMWPDFSPEDYNHAVRHYSSKERSFGARLSQHSA